MCVRACVHPSRKFQRLTNIDGRIETSLHQSHSSTPALPPFLLRVFRIYVFVWLTPMRPLSPVGVWRRDHSWNWAVVAQQPTLFVALDRFEELQLAPKTLLYSQPPESAAATFLLLFLSSPSTFSIDSLID
eukprot:GHVU01165871.1.p1 GENE.GHVU01165871.1~~GHVU01165871.1.p1  ORF type:complete len:131 (+),score=7.95 GHVU01165871.1:61-453(+)